MFPGMILVIRRMVNRIKGLSNSGEELLKTPPEGYENVPPQYCSTCDELKSPAFYSKKVKTDTNKSRRAKRQRSRKLGKLFRRSDSASDTETTPPTIEPPVEPKDQIQILVKCSACLSPMVLPPKGAQSTYQPPLQDQSQDTLEENGKQESTSGEHDNDSKSKSSRAKSSADSGNKTSATCPSCGLAWPAEASFCPKDGTPKTKATSQSAS